MVFVWRQLGKAREPVEVQYPSRQLALGRQLVNAEAVAVFRRSDGFASESGDSLPGECPELRMISPHSDAVPQAPPLAGSSREAFDLALTERRDELLQYMQKRLRDRDAGADLAQEALSRMMKYRDSPDIEDHGLLLFRIANNLITEYHRTRQRRHANSHFSLDETEPLRDHAPAVEAIVEVRQALDTLLKHTIVSLPPKCRLAFMLSRFDGLTYPQIADRMGISVKMVEKHITKALLACRQAVGDRDF